MLEKKHFFSVEISLDRVGECDSGRTKEPRGRVSFVTYSITSNAL